MNRIELNGQPSGKCGFLEIYHPELGKLPPLERLIGTARELGFELVEMGVAKIHDVCIGRPYEGPVIYLRDKRAGTKAVISQRREGRGIVFSLHYYTIRGE